MVQDAAEGRTRQVVIFRTIREDPARLLEYYVVDDDGPAGAYACFEWLCEESGMEPCRVRHASAEAILATIIEPSRDLPFDGAVDALTAELERAAQDDGGQRVLFGYVRKLACAPGETIH
ncbi:hypothetical protein [Pelagibacterium lacus]|uniref:Uncharacterized protein n=1 Tax=Pelagibacterium lacus TaxID=2282655 RepID=A0A369W5E3_9HYPH|nr:hypothetical protein [Pelagibacterium lacus]RDE09894.1 hypothetical protein DVH29_05010 [Pelagibacterium lacus]